VTPGSTTTADAHLTQVLNAAAAGDEQAAQRLLPVIYAQLRGMAQAQLRDERRDVTLQPTALVHEAWLRLFGRASESWTTRGHFFYAAGEAMRRILVERARARRRLKRGGDWERIPLGPELLSDDDRDDEILALDEALERLGRSDPRKARVVTLRFFAGLSVVETAHALDVSTRLVELEWTRARAWLLDALSDEPLAATNARPG